jgi:transglutaminase-like putative cysteine protease
MRYAIRHVTRFNYESPITESVMEARMQPRTDTLQRCLQFTLLTNPSSRVMTYRDHDNNLVHHFNIPGRHSRLTVTAEALIECMTMRPLPHRLGPAAWPRVDAMAASGQWFDYLAPSTFVMETPKLEALKLEIGLERGNDPLVALRRLMGEMYARFEYSPRSTRVDSPIDEALEARKGVCQDFAHIFLSLVRPLGIPARYVSGYLFQAAGSQDRSTDGATHAWVEVLLPDLGWVGLDPTNNLIADDRHIRDWTRLRGCSPDTRSLQGRQHGSQRIERVSGCRASLVAALERPGAIYVVDGPRARRTGTGGRRRQRTSATTATTTVVADNGKRALVAAAFRYFGS